MLYLSPDIGTIPCDPPQKYMIEQYNVPNQTLVLYDIFILRYGYYILYIPLQI